MALVEGAGLEGAAGRAGRAGQQGGPWAFLGAGSAGISRRRYNRALTKIPGNLNREPAGEQADHNEAKAALK